MFTWPTNALQEIQRPAVEIAVIVMPSVGPQSKPRPSNLTVMVLPFRCKTLYKSMAVGSSPERPNLVQFSMFRASEASKLGNTLQLAAIPMK